MKDEIPWDTQCRWASGTLRCRYPVGLFLDGIRSGFCLFHRSKPSGFDAARIADDSQAATGSDYLDRATAQTYGRKLVSPSVVETAQAIAARHGNKPWTDKPILPVMREPGADESERAT